MKLGGWNVTEDSQGDPIYYNDAEPDYFYTYDQMIQIVSESSGSPTSGNMSASTWVDLVTKILPQVPAYITAFQLADVNVERARRGLSPINTAAYGPQVGVNLAPQTQQMIMFGVIGLIAFMLLNRASR